MRQSMMMSDFQVHELTENPSYQRFIDNLSAFPSGFVHVEPFNQVLPRVFLKNIPAIKSFEVRDDDVWISSFPKCGKKKTNS